MMKRKYSLVITAFVLVELALYLLILTTNDKWYMFASIALCLIHSLLYVRTGDRFIAMALCFTLVADFFLVLCTEQQRLYGMVFFLGAQMVYALRLQRHNFRRGFVMVRITLIVVAEIIGLLILGSGVDLLAIISLCYYANLIVNIIEGFSQFSINRLFPIGMLLFLLCDTVIGLQVATDSYLTLSANSILRDVLYPGFNLAWLFYLPSQVMLSLCTIRGRKGRKFNENSTEAA